MPVKEYIPVQMKETQQPIVLKDFGMGDMGMHDMSGMHDTSGMHDMSGMHEM